MKNATVPAPSLPAVLTVRRRIDAPADELFDAWLDPSALAQWMRPPGIERTEARLDAREGGAFEIVMHTADGPVHHSGVYRRIERPHRLVFTWVSPFTDAHETLVSVEFRADRGSTEVVVTHERLPAQWRADHEQGWAGALVQLEARATAR